MIYHILSQHQLKTLCIRWETKTSSTDPRSPHLQLPSSKQDEISGDSKSNEREEKQLGPASNITNFSKNFAAGIVAATKEAKVLKTGTGKESKYKEIKKSYSLAKDTSNWMVSFKTTH